MFCRIVLRNILIIIKENEFYEFICDKGADKSNEEFFMIIL